MRIARSVGCLHVDALMDSLEPHQWDELVTAERVDPSGDRRMDMLAAYIVSKLYLINGDGKTHISMWDVLHDLDDQMAGNRGDEPVKATPGQMAAMATGGR